MNFLTEILSEITKTVDMSILAIVISSGEIAKKLIGSKLKPIYGVLIISILASVPYMLYSKISISLFIVSFLVSLGFYDIFLKTILKRLNILPSAKRTGTIPPDDDEEDDAGNSTAG